MPSLIEMGVLLSDDSIALPPYERIDTLIERPKAMSGSILAFHEVLFYKRRGCSFRFGFFVAIYRII